ncbi:hypothetical protein HU200_040508 [Digitaria exilis]|uniref:Uncharacterized protein n=1 Tax=Digitaria exilis TaxID=1010633 RepID=A0A835B7P3_9POAL|nr:hypothetical protein HU200_040508 [Digitaria exilis]
MQQGPPSPPPSLRIVVGAYLRDTRHPHYTYLHASTHTRTSATPAYLCRLVEERSRSKEMDNLYTEHTPLEWLAPLLEFKFLKAFLEHLASRKTKFLKECPNPNELLGKEHRLFFRTHCVGHVLSFAASPHAVVAVEKLSGGDLEGKPGMTQCEECNRGLLDAGYLFCSFGFKFMVLNMVSLMRRCKYAMHRGLARPWPMLTLSVCPWFVCYFGDCPEHLLVHVSWDAEEACNFFCTDCLDRASSRIESLSESMARDRKEKTAASTRTKKDESVAAPTARSKKEAPTNEESWQPSTIEIGHLQELMWLVFPSEDTGDVTVFRCYFEVRFVSARKPDKPVVIDDNSPPHKPPTIEVVSSVQAPSPVPKKADGPASASGGIPAFVPIVGVKQEREMPVGEGHHLKKPQIRRAPPPVAHPAPGWTPGECHYIGHRRALNYNCCTKKNPDPFILNRWARGGDEEDAGVMVGVVEEVGATMTEVVEEIPRVLRSQLPEDEVPPPIGNQFRLGFVDDDEETQLFDRELDLSELKQRQELVVSCFRAYQKSALLQRFVQHQAVMEFLEARLNKERAAIKKSHDEMEALKTKVEERVKGHLLVETERDQLKWRTEAESEILEVCHQLKAAEELASTQLVEFGNLKNAKLEPKNSAIGTTGNSWSHEALIRELRDVAKELPSYVLTHVLSLVKALKR